MEQHILENGLIILDMGINKLKKIFFIRKGVITWPDGSKFEG